MSTTRAKGGREAGDAPASVSWRAHRDQLLADPAVREEYERLAPRFSAVRALVAARTEAGLSQRELAERMGSTQAVVSRLESAAHSPRLDTLAAAARAMGYDLEVRFVPRPAATSAAEKKRTRRAAEGRGGYRAGKGRG